MCGQSSAKIVMSSPFFSTTAFRPESRTLTLISPSWIAESSIQSEAQQLLPPASEGASDTSSPFLVSNRGGRDKRRIGQWLIVPGQATRLDVSLHRYWPHRYVESLNHG